MKILIVEDERQLRENIKRYLELDGYEVDTEANGNMAIDKILDNHYSCVVLDLNIEGVDGTEVCKQIRSEGNTSPIIVLTARKSQTAIIQNLDIGADDFMNKPFDMAELSARIRALIRRNLNVTNLEEIHLGKDILIKPLSKLVTKGGTLVRLSPLEYALLEYLAINKGKVCSRSDIITNVWGEYEDQLYKQTLDVHISNLRKKLDRSIILSRNKGLIIE